MVIHSRFGSASGGRLPMPADKPAPNTDDPVYQTGQLIRHMDQDQLRQVNELIRARFRMESELKKYEYRPGDSVMFYSTKRGQHVYGTVQKIMPKNIKVRASDGMVWTVSPGLLSKREG